MTIAAPRPLTSTDFDADDAARVEASLDALFRSKFSTADAYGPDARTLWDAAGRTVRGGKLVRPRLLLSAYRALAGARDVPEFVIDAAVAVELLHYAFILHDDVIDGDTVRRGRPNLIGELSSRAAGAGRAGHWGATGGILMGDLVLSAAYQRLARLEVSHDARVRVFDLVDAVIDETVAGEWADVTLADGLGTPTLMRTLEMSANKTACYTFELPLRFAAILAGAPDATERALAAAGRHLGIAYQLDDDLLSAFGDPSAHGKDPLSDLREGKQTPLIAFARTTDRWHMMRDDVGRADLSAADAERVRRVLTDCGARAFVEDLRDAAIAQVETACAERTGSIPVAAADVVLACAHRLHRRSS